MDDRRSQERFELELSALIEVMSKPASSEVLIKKTKNISSKGAYFETPNSFPSGTKVEVLLILSSKSIQDITGMQGYVQARGSIIRSDSNGMAVKFDQFSFKNV